MLFKSRREKTIQAAVDGIEPLLNIVEAACGRSCLVWRDPYMLGFFVSTLSFYVRKGGMLDDRRDIINASLNVMELDARTILALYDELWAASDADMLRGFDNAASLNLYRHDLLKDE